MQTGDEIRMVRSMKINLKQLTKKGFTITELIVSTLFVVLIMGTASYAWWVGNQSFQSTSQTSIAYSQARSLETMIQSAAANTPSLQFTETPLSNTGAVKYSQFYFDETGDSPIYTVSFYGDDSTLSPIIMQFPAIDSVQFSVKMLGNGCLLKYRVESTDEKVPFYIDGGIILNKIDEAQFQADNPGSTLSSVLNFQVPAE